MTKADRMNGLEEAWPWAKKVQGVRPLPLRAVVGTVAVSSWNQCSPKARENNFLTMASWSGRPGGWQTSPAPPL